MMRLIASCRMSAPIDIDTLMERLTVLLTAGLCVPYTSNLQQQFQCNPTRCDEMIASITNRYRSITATGGLLWD
jgi:hypothetical protein